MALRTEWIGVELDSPMTARRVIEYLCEPGVVESVVQPVVRPADQLIVGYEALARMPIEPVRGPDFWLAMAAEVGLRSRLEIACLSAAVAMGPTPEDRLLFVNLSPSLLADPDALRLLDRLPDRLVIELTEQEAVDDYCGLRRDLAPWLARGVRIAIDDTGAGYSSLRHVIELTPDFLKLDRELVRDLDHDRNRRALVSAVAAFASEVGTSVIAEGVETETELDALREAEVDLVQGYLLARPGPAWPSISPECSQGHLNVVHPQGTGQLSAEEKLADALGRASDPRTACSVVVEYLFRQGQIMPSAYLERHGELRCLAQRGLWQILDGMPGSAGITGRTWRTGRPIVVPRRGQEPRLPRGHPRRGLGDLRPHHHRWRGERCTQRRVVDSAPWRDAATAGALCRSVGGAIARHQRPSEGFGLGPRRHCLVGHFGNRPEGADPAASGRLPPGCIPDGLGGSHHRLAERTLGRRCGRSAGQQHHRARPPRAHLALLAGR